MFDLLTTETSLGYFRA